MKVLQTSDWHLRDSDIEECRKVTGYLVVKATELEPDLIVIAGDIFDSREIRMGSAAASLAVLTIQNLANVAPVAILTGTRSHDGDAPSILREMRAEYPIYVAERPEQVLLIEHGGPDTQMSFYPFSMLDMGGERFIPFGRHVALLSFVPPPTKQFFQTAADIKTADQEIGQALTGMFAGFAAEASGFDCPHILVGHFQVQGSRKTETQVLAGNDIEITRGQLELAQADIVALGHIHLPQVVFTGCFYSGSLYAENIGEDHAHGFYLHDFERGELDSRPEYQGSEFIEVPTRRIIRTFADFTEDRGLVESFPFNVDARGAHVRFEIKVHADQANQIDKEALRKQYMDDGATDVDIRIIRVPRENVRSEKIIHCKTLREKLTEMGRLRGEEVSESVLQKADLLEAETPEAIVAGVAG